MTVCVLQSPRQPRPDGLCRFMRWSSRDTRPCCAVVMSMMLCVSAASCRGLPRHRTAKLDPLEYHQAVAWINDNHARIDGVLKATGRVQARVRTSERQLRTFDLDGILLFCSPENLYFELRHDLAGEQLIVGSNGREYWYINKAEREPPVCRPYVQLVHGRDPDLPVQPAQLVEAIGLSAVPTADSMPLSTRMVSRITPENQELLFVTDGPAGAAPMVKEYWLSRDGKRVLHRILFRDAMGRVELESVLSGHLRLGEEGPVVPSRITLRWPLDQSYLDFRIREWTEYFDKGPDLPAFHPPGRPPR